MQCQRCGARDVDASSGRLPAARCLHLPDPYVAFYLDRSQDPYGGGYHGWDAGVDVKSVMPYMRKPNKGEDVYVCGETCAELQGWVEGALCTVERMLSQAGLLAGQSRQDLGLRCQVGHLQRARERSSDRLGAGCARMRSLGSSGGTERATPTYLHWALAGVLFESYPHFESSPLVRMTTHAQEEDMNCPEMVRALALGLAVTSTLALPAAIRIDAQVPTDVVVQFGPGHPQPVAPGNHVLVPDEVTILKGGTVTFQVNGGGHAIAIYPVHKHTTRAEIEADLCPGGPGGPCAGVTANPGFLITDGKDDVVVDIAPFAGAPFFDYAPERVIYAIGGSGLFLNGSTNPAVLPSPPAPGARVQHRFEKTGRFLVICANRFHAVNDYMFGFVNVVGGD